MAVGEDVFDAPTASCCRAVGGLPIAISRRMKSPFGAYICRCPKPSIAADPNARIVFGFGFRLSVKEASDLTSLN